VRQIKVLGHDLPDGPKYQQQLPAKVLQVQICEAELLKVFKLLTAEVQPLAKVDACMSKKSVQTCVAVP